MITWLLEVSSISCTGHLKVFLWTLCKCCTYMLVEMTWDLFLWKCSVAVDAQIIHIIDALLFNEPISPHVFTVHSWGLLPHRPWFKTSSSCCPHNFLTTLPCLTQCTNFFIIIYFLSFLVPKLSFCFLMSVATCENICSKELYLYVSGMLSVNDEK